MSCDHFYAGGSICALCGHDGLTPATRPKPAVEAPAAPVQPRNRPLDPIDALNPSRAAQNSNRYAHLEPHERYVAAELDARAAGPPRDGHDYTWTRYLNPTTQHPGTPLNEPIYSYKWVRDDELRRNARHDFWSIPVGLLILLVLYHIVTKL